MTGRVAAMRTWAHARHPKHRAHQRARAVLSLRPSAVASLLEMTRRVLLLIIVAGICAVLFNETLSLYRQRDARATLSEYRGTVYDLANIVRAMRTKAISQRHPFELRIDKTQRSLTLSSLSRGSLDYSALERSMWLPEGLEIVEAPLWITAQSNGSLTPAEIVITASALQRLFRLTTTLSGTVELHEEPTS